MTGITRKIDNSIIYWLKLHWIDEKDLREHLKKLSPDTEITPEWTNARLQLLQEEARIEQVTNNGRTVWKVCGDEPSITNMVWNTITSLVKLEMDIPSIIHVVTQLNPRVTTDQITNKIGILQTNEIVHLKNELVTVSSSEKPFLKRRYIHAE